MTKTRPTGDATGYRELKPFEAGNLFSTTERFGRVRITPEAPLVGVLVRTVRGDFFVSPEAAIPLKGLTAADKTRLVRIGRTSCCSASRSMPIDIMGTSDNRLYVNQEPRTLLTRTFYKRFGDFEYTYSAEQLGCHAAGQAAPRVQAD